MKFTVIVNWVHRDQPERNDMQDWQDVINYLAYLHSVGFYEKVKSLIVQPTIPVDATTSTQRHLTAEQLKAA